MTALVPKYHPGCRAVRHHDGAIALGFILYVVALIVFGNADWAGAGIGLGMFAAVLTLIGVAAAT